MTMPDDLRLLVNMLNAYLDGDVPMPKCFIFGALMPCRHTEEPGYADDHDDYEHAMAHDDDDTEAKFNFTKLTDYMLMASEEYEQAHL